MSPHLRPLFTSSPLLLLAALCTLLIPTATAQNAPGPASFNSRIRPILKDHCLECHSTAKHKGDLNLERFDSESLAARHPEIWEAVAEQVHLGEMPPKDAKPLPPAERETLLQWTSALLERAALERAGDPGPVVLRRLSNAEYRYTLRDLTGIPSLDPTAGFPGDSAAGEGFMNVGQALVISPALLTKYLDAAKSVANHAVLLPHGIRFSESTTRRDWTEEILTRIRHFYARYTEPGGGSAVNLQGIKFDTRDGGVLPLAAYLNALLPPASPNSTSSTDHTPDAPQLSTRYLAQLRAALDNTHTSPVLDQIRARWRQARPGDGAALAQDILRWQQALWRFNSVGHIGKLNGPSAWLEPVNPLQPTQELRQRPLVATNQSIASLFITATDAGDGPNGDFVLLQRPRFVAPGKPDLLLSDLQQIHDNLVALRERAFAAATRCLDAADPLAAVGGPPPDLDLNRLARRHDVDPDLLRAWLDCLGLSPAAPTPIEGIFTNRISQVAGYSAASGWGSPETPNAVANAADSPLRIPGNLPGHAVAIHPSPKLAAVATWVSPVHGILHVEALIQHAHPECGNGVTWTLDHRRGPQRKRLASGTSQGAREIRPPAIETLAVIPGDAVSLRIGAREGNHSCDLTRIDLTLRLANTASQTWNLAEEISSQAFAQNPAADRHGNPRVWHFHAEPDNAAPTHLDLPTGSLLTRWLSAPTPAERRTLTRQIGELLASHGLHTTNAADQKLYQHLASFEGPLLQAGIANPTQARATRRTNPPQRPAATAILPTAQSFGHHPNGSSIAATDLCFQAPATLEIRVPAELVAGREFLATAGLHTETGAEGSVQIEVRTERPTTTPTLTAGTTGPASARSTWTDPDRPSAHSAPILVQDGSPARRRFEKAFDEFRDLFPAALCYTKIVPVDEVVTLTLYHREDGHLARLLLDPAEVATLDRLWDELHYVSQDALTLVDAFEQLWQYATQDADPKVFEPMRTPIATRAAAFRQRLLETEPAHLEAVLDFAIRAYRRPLEAQERENLLALYRTLRAQDLDHESAIRMLLARTFASPAFLYRAETPPPGSSQGPVNDHELASRLSYFLWSSAPDAALRAEAAAGRLRDPEILVAQTRRMLEDERARRLATEFACAWLHVYDFHELSEKSERHFPEFNKLRGAMYEETIRFFTDLFQKNGSILDILDADHTFLNDELAAFYGVPNVTGPDWRRVEHMKTRGRGGILGQATTLAKQSGASRTSPILRGNWLSEVLLGDKLPRPPRNVPQLPEDEAASERTQRELVERHSSDPNCMGCHRRIDPYGFALEAFDAIGRHRTTDLGGRPVDTHARTLEGAEFDGLDGLRQYLLTRRRDAFLKQFCRKLLGYALGRSVLLSDTPLIAEMRRQLEANHHHVAAAIETIVRSRQFREIRGRDHTPELATSTPQGL